MAAKPLTDEAIALTEKKMDMALDDIIKMSKTNSVKPKKQRVSNRGQKLVSNAGQDRFVKGRNFLDTRSSLRQGALARRRSNFQGNQFLASSEAARKAAVAPIRNRDFNQRRTFNGSDIIKMLNDFQSGAGEPRPGKLFPQKPAKPFGVSGGGSVYLSDYSSFSVDQNAFIYICLALLVLNCGYPCLFRWLSLIICVPPWIGCLYWAVATTVQKVAANGGGFTVKRLFQQANIAPKQKPQTLDSLFANMKEQRMRNLSQQSNGEFRLTLPGVSQDGRLPRHYQADGQGAKKNISPPVEWYNVPEGAKSLALVARDIDAPEPEAPIVPFNIWVVVDIPPTMKGLPEGFSGKEAEAGIKEGTNDLKKHGWEMPKMPNPGHRIEFKLLALDLELNLGNKVTVDKLLEASEGHVVGEAVFIVTT
ncbi:hypothetical protein SASPL_127852 [Salvia splendens]|uniref:Uncharacterized protein n=1 Tax=Salvia splendens TaxID=180675 RepID=A0A8X8XA94_SALSN|nr:hypothetical protein SASPL_127852 [Salvia splendens]